MSPIAYVVMTVWLLFFGIVFYVLAFVIRLAAAGRRDQNLLQAFFGGTTLFYLPLLVFAPVLTMRLLAEERASGTIEPLMTAPVSEAADRARQVPGRADVLVRALAADAELRVARRAHR